MKGVYLKDTFFKYVWSWRENVVGLSQLANNNNKSKRGKRAKRMMSSKEERTTESADKGEKEHNDKRKCKWRECCNPERVDCDGYCEYHRNASPGTDAQSQRDRQRSSRDRKRPSASPSDDGLPGSAIATAIENIKDSDVSDEPSSTVSRGNDATSSSAADGLCPKCTVCKKRLARRSE